jgi:hypothetical protein
MIILANAFSESLQHIVGFLNVLVVLTLLWGLTAAVGTFFARRDRAAAAAAGLIPVTAAAPTGDGIPEDEVAVIAATVSLILGRRHRIVSIRGANLDWAREGRRQHFASHKIR